MNLDNELYAIMEHHNKLLTAILTEPDMLNEGVGDKAKTVLAAIKRTIKEIIKKIKNIITKFLNLFRKKQKEKQKETNQRPVEALKKEAAKAKENKKKLKEKGIDDEKLEELEKKILSKKSVFRSIFEEFSSIESLTLPRYALSDDVINAEGVENLKAKFQQDNDKMSKQTEELKAMMAGDIENAGELAKEFTGIFVDSYFSVDTIINDDNIDTLQKNCEKFRKMLDEWINTNFVDNIEDAELAELVKKTLTQSYSVIVKTLIFIIDSITKDVDILTKQLTEYNKLASEKLK